MNHELDLYGVFVPDLLIWAVLSFVISIPMRRLLSAMRVYRFVWHRPLFDLALYILLLGGVAAFSQKVGS